MDIHLLSLCALCAAFLLCRYVFFDLHGMIQWPRLLFILGVVVIALARFSKAKRVSVFTAIAYIGGFLAGLAFQTGGTDPGGGKTNDFWMIWTAVFFCGIVIGIIWDFVSASKKSTHNKT